MTEFVTISMGPERQMSHRVLVAVPPAASWSRAATLLGTLAHQRIFGCEFFVALPEVETAEAVAWVKLLRLLGLNQRQARIFTIPSPGAPWAGITSCAALLQPWLVCLVGMEAGPGEAVREEIAAAAVRCRRDMQVVLAAGPSEEPVTTCREFFQRLQDSAWVMDRVSRGTDARTESDLLIRHIRSRSMGGGRFCAQAKCLGEEKEDRELQLLATGRRRMEEIARANRYLAVAATGEGGING